jgi:hypothetical protein
MTRTTTLFVFFLLTRFPVLAQQPKSLPTPEDAFTTRDLIAWSHLQAPQPAPQPLPPREGQVPQPSQAQDQQPKSPADPHTEQEPVQAFTGIILNDSSRYLLIAVNTAPYQLDAQDELRVYENRTVKILGRFDPGAHCIKVLRIEPLR